jgi:hypothetical protein
MTHPNKNTESAYLILMHLGKLLADESKREAVDVPRLYTQCEQLLKLASAELTLVDVSVQSAA